MRLQRTSCSVERGVRSSTQLKQSSVVVIGHRSTWTMRRRRSDRKLRSGRRRNWMGCVRSRRHFKRRRSAFNESKRDEPSGKLGRRRRRSANASGFRNSTRSERSRRRSSRSGRRRCRRSATNEQRKEPSGNRNDSSRRLWICFFGRARPWPKEHDVRSWSGARVWSHLREHLDTRLDHEPVKARTRCGLKDFCQLR